MCLHAILLILCLELSFILSYATIWPGCSCVTYDSQHRSEGEFHSPNYPDNYPPNLNCILYTFKGEVDEIVEISFRVFDIRTKSPNKCLDGETADYLRLYLDLDRPEVNERTEFTSVICGNMTMIQKDYYSSGRIIMMEFHSGNGAQKNVGFRGRFRFLAADQYKQDCMKVIGPECRYICNSTVTKTGKFFSQGYPQNYKSKTQCHYVFRGTPRERVHIKFKNIQLGHAPGSCHVGQNDKIIIHDGPNKQSSVIKELCNDGNNIEFESSLQDMYVHFNSSGFQPKKGFTAHFEFLPRENTTTPSTDTDLSTNTQPGSTTSGSKESCNHNFSSFLQKEGTNCTTINSILYPKPQKCTYSFSGSGKEKVQLNFTDFHLKNPLSRCDDKAELFASGEDEAFGTYCRSNQGDGISLAMSHNNKLEVQFTSATESDMNIKKTFCFHYKFRTDNGLKCENGDALNNTECGCEFRSERAANGTFSSPNYPGNYPKQTECHYRFYGRPKERVRITFKSFDLEGVANSCKDPAIMADYVEFSDFIPPDKARIAKCGSRPEDKPDPVMSDHQFFRMMFKSNEDDFYGTGFEATYEFISSDASSDELKNTGVLCKSRVYYLFIPALAAFVLLKNL
ncbi:suppressor of lurcher protein 1-like [Lingula anatina]|uniref:Suppressor of lurcher protein 1-like n=1 Tax=Lingula anatina TaxID=7574 RepID=A0A1S3K7B3_LINAN|nr:suppressor of lurcher protein 1-like [Lingula anatina]XP_013418317.1 suppressor of lurcher protein 1-like [Lingula anatina]XP_013418326.1 suppressor of lurcher protein 1-like [Lingula anatina]XP_013418334.1 suppressor of lurcher protein 1-like [Lingula anatina]|eukprot:XP_013418307.1 suppressor of lurcher protein 1-like [Lingula anatina]